MEAHKCDSKSEVGRRGFIPRTTKKSLGSEEISFEDFLSKRSTCSTTIIKGIAGSGKTFFLKKIHEILVEKFPTFDILLVSLKGIKEVQFDDFSHNFVEEIIKILNFGEEFSKKFSEKFKKGEVKILLDGYDEFSQKNKENLLKILQIYNDLELNNKNQIFVTTRDELKQVFPTIFEYNQYILEPLKFQEQVNFLTEFWVENDPNLELELIENCAKMLVNKIITLSRLIGEPLIIHGLGEVFKNQIDQNFSAKIENLNILNVFERILGLNLINSNEAIVSASDSLIKSFRFHAICYLFDEELSDSLRSSHDVEKMTPEIIKTTVHEKFNKNGAFEFNHVAHAEFLVAKFIFGFLECEEDPSKPQLELLLTVLMDEKFHITRMLLNEMLKGKTFNFPNEKFCEAIENFENGE